MLYAFARWALFSQWKGSKSAPSFSLQILQILYLSAMINLDSLVDFVTFLFADDKFLEAALFATAWT